MKTWKEIIENKWMEIGDTKKLKVGDKIAFQKDGKGQTKTGVISAIKPNGYFYINNGATSVDALDILKRK